MQRYFSLYEREIKKNKNEDFENLKDEYPSTFDALSMLDKSDSKIILNLLKRLALYLRISETSLHKSLLYKEYKEYNRKYIKFIFYDLVYGKGALSNKKPRQIENELEKYFGKNFNIDVSSNEKEMLTIALNKNKDRSAPELSLDTEDKEISEYLDKSFPKSAYKLYKTDDSMLDKALVLFNIEDIEGERETVKLLNTSHDVESMKNEPINRIKSSIKGKTLAPLKSKKKGGGYVIFNDFENEDKFNGKKKVGAISKVPWYKFINDIEKLSNKEIPLPSKIKKLKDELIER